MGLKIYNSLTRRKEEFKPLEEGRVGIYVCGPTVYGHPHLGHAKSYVSFDILVRYLRYLGYSVTYVQNITDVGHLTDDADEGEDKLVVAAKKEKKHPMALAEDYTRSYFEDMDRLNCRRPDISPRATGHIIEQIEMVKTLLEKGYAYEVNGSVYFEVAKFADYGKLSRRNLDEMLEGVRVEVSPDKKAPADFALWKKAEPNHIMQWPSPWGPGFPGWHLECSVMSMKYLGKTIDIHGGGLENQFPHHDCEIAQSEAANGVQFVRFWMHNNMVTVDNQKMGKSLNNFITLKQAFSGAHERLTRDYDPMAVRQLILNSHYRSPLDFSDAALFAAQSGYQKITEAVKAVRKKMATAVEGQADKTMSKQLKQLRVKFETAMNDDLNTSVALSVLFELVRLTQSLLEDDNANVGTLNLIDVLFDRLGGDVLGIVRDEYPQAGADDDEVVEKLVDIVIQQRNRARANKDFEKADELRARLDEIGIVLEDKQDFTTWRTK
ncbi:MAG: cysteine--tRNA ligase [Phycisphaerae bacterium]|nr:cysteine--tRNA ligase [Phycisphaerae bacterium]NIW70752.1 cysteine--tRNA ligase [candidate division KSB1 bacterium]NIP51501.1 cysteine--tRNA ligase [Phycisphaerae bacterium]NIS50681.1 cysteine--tRNA ligase [Phycisphaerae bacterium]NIU08437.1 cysteine--tRNA ligase [Phycisphaerae bacterium]